MMDFFVLGWFCGFSTGTIMGWDAAFQECYNLSPQEPKLTPSLWLWEEAAGSTQHQGDPVLCCLGLSAARLVMGLLPQPAAESLVCATLAKLMWNVDPAKSVRLGQ